MKKYEYMVVYNFGQGIGRLQIVTSNPIENYDDVEALDKTIREHNGMDNAFAIDFKLLRECKE